MQTFNCEHQCEVGWEISFLVPLLTIDIGVDVSIELFLLKVIRQENLWTYVTWKYVRITLLLRRLAPDR